MKLQPVLTIFSVAISALLGYVIYSTCCDDNTNMLLLTILSSISIFLILFSGTGLKYNANSDTSIKILSVIFAVISFAASLVMSFTTAGQATIIIVSSTIILTYLLIFYLLRLRRSCDVPVLRPSRQDRIPDTAAYRESLVAMELQIIDDHQYLSWQFYLHVTFLLLVSDR